MAPTLSHACETVGVLRLGPESVGAAGPMVGQRAARISRPE